MQNGLIKYDCSIEMAAIIGTGGYITIVINIHTHWYNCSKQTIH